MNHNILTKQFGSCWVACIPEIGVSVIGKTHDEAVQGVKDALHLKEDIKEYTLPTYYVRIYMSGPIDVVKQVCREECYREGLCVTVDPTTFIYTGGEEFGVVVGLIHYPRFPSSEHHVWERANDLAINLMKRTCQHSVLLLSPTETKWITQRKD